MGVIQKLIINNKIFIQQGQLSISNEMLYKSLYISLFFVNYKIYPCYKYYVAGAILYKSGYPRLIFHELAFFGYLQGGYIIFTA